MANLADSSPRPNNPPRTHGNGLNQPCVCNLALAETGARQPDTVAKGTKWFFRSPILTNELVAEPLSRPPRFSKGSTMQQISLIPLRSTTTYNDFVTGQKHTVTGRRDFPIVCVGGSAGGLDAYIRLLKHMPGDMGAAIVVVNHLRHVATYLHEILPKYTKMPVELVTEGLKIEPNHVFIIPEKRDLHVNDGKFVLKPISKPHGWPDVITIFLQSITKCWDGKVIAVIVSGYDGDGADALCGIKDVGGTTIAQKLDTAEHPDMPESAIASGCIDFVLSPEEIARKIVEITTRPNCI